MDTRARVMLDGRNVGLVPLGMLSKIVASPLVSLDKVVPLPWSVHFKTERSAYPVCLEEIHYNLALHYLGCCLAMG